MHQASSPPLIHGASSREQAHCRVYAVVAQSLDRVAMVQRSEHSHHPNYHISKRSKGFRQGDSTIDDLSNSDSAQTRLGGFGRSHEPESIGSGSRANCANWPFPRPPLQLPSTSESHRRKPPIHFTFAS
ncbi:hypothetical protein HBH75_053400 [Parastagonospora nodorum]|nr:hypothetical protein HBH75_053400 [Parastagonospora nodorum]